MTNYTALETCASTGSTYACQLPVEDGLVRFEPQDISLCLGGNTSWEQRRAFEWGYLGAIARRNGDDTTVAYCASRITALQKEHGY